MFSRGELLRKQLEESLDCGRASHEGAVKLPSRVQRMYLIGNDIRRCNMLGCYKNQAKTSLAEHARAVRVCPTNR